MKVICPYTNLQYATELTLRIEEPDTRFVYVGKSDTDYYDLVQQLWAEQETFIIVEHDIVIWPGALKEMWSCPMDFCNYHAPSGPYSVGLGVLKYSKNLMIGHPEHVDKIDLSERSWKMLDKGLTWELLNYGVGFHGHQPMVSHVNPLRFDYEMISEKRGSH